MYQIDQSDELKDVLRKLFKKDKRRYDAILNKMIEISTSQNIQHYKNLRAPKNHLKRVHVDSHFVLTFSVNEKEKIVKFVDFEHHDKAYL